METYVEGPAFLEEERLSCSYIEGGLTFQNHGITACCAVHEGHNWPILYPYNGDLNRLPVDELLEKRYELQLQVAEGENPICKHCHSLIKRKWGKTEYPFRLISVQNDLRCNICCEYCNFLVKWSDYQKNYQTYKMYPLIKQMIDEKLLAPDAQFFWAGGEPSILDEFSQCLEAVFEYSDKIRLQIATNATALSQELKNICYKYGKQINVLCSLDSGTRETYQAVKGKDYFDVVVKNLSEYTQLVNQVFLKMILTATNIKDVDAFLDVARRLQLKQVFYDIDCTQNMDEVPDEIIEAMAYLGLKALTYGIVAVPASVWQFHEKIDHRVQYYKNKIIGMGAQRPAPSAQRPAPSAQRPAPSAQRPAPNIVIRTDGKNNAAFANEVFIINISSNVSPVVVRFDEANTQGIEIMQCVVQESVESPTGKKILLADTTESLELFCEDEMLFIWVQCSKWAGIMSVEEDGVKNTFDLYSEIPENRMIVYRRKVRLVE